ncbi:N-acetylmuramoyl-L-alanine amidase [Streptomyces sp. NBC_01465]|uniref:N-acetylmuramoyl-L-alanine amidase n=1 Tax=Streptomyces sp. NBC_01465 TaxID=2903878 RepID=UPI003FCCD8B0
MSAIAAALVAGSTGTTAFATPDASLQSQFAEAARKYRVPQSVLMAVSYRQTLWETHGGQPSTTGAYNVMGLTRVRPQDMEQPSAVERLAGFDRSGDPAVVKRSGAGHAPGSGRADVDTDDPRLHTLERAARLIGAPADSLQRDSATSIRAGAALLAAYQREAGGALPKDPGGWYPAVARYSQSSDGAGSQLFASRVFDSIRSGESRTTADGERVVLPADPSVTPVVAATSYARTTATPKPECPAALRCTFVPAGYAANSAPDDYGDYNVANRPAGGEDIRQIVIHDTEGGYEGSLEHFKNPAVYASTHYLIRASDGLVTQMVRTKDEAWHAANKTVNMHSIGIEHEGYAIKAGSWYTEPQYESSAALVKYLAARFSVPLDREHIIGHDEVPGVLDGSVASQHWDPGPFWDWNHYMSLLGAPVRATSKGGPPKAGQLVRYAPPFTRANRPKLTNDGAPVAAQPANFGYLYTAPSTGAPVVTDPYLGSPLWSDGANWADKIVAGGAYVVAESRPGWTAVWYGGHKAWFANPGGRFTVPVSTRSVTAKAGAKSVPVYGRAYPEKAAYAGTKVKVQDSNDASLTKYAVPAGQRYALAGAAVTGDYYYGGTVDGKGPGSRTLVKGKTTFYPIRYNHRIAWVRVSDVRPVR